MKKSIHCDVQNRKHAFNPTPLKKKINIRVLKNVKEKRGKMVGYTILLLDRFQFMDMGL